MACAVGEKFFPFVRSIPFIKIDNRLETFPSSGMHIYTQIYEPTFESIVRSFVRSRPITSPERCIVYVFA